MRVIQIEDNDRKIELLAAKHEISETYKNSEELENCKKSSHVDPGFAVMDVGSFPDQTRDDLLKIGEDLAAKGWRVIFWSSAVGPLDVRDDCWFENRDDKIGAEAIASAISERVPDTYLTRGTRRNTLELSLELLSTLLPFGLLWEVSGQTHEPIALADSANNLKTDGMTDLGRLFAERVKTYLSGAASPPWRVRRYKREVGAIDDLLETISDDVPIARLWAKGGVQKTPSVLDEVLKTLAESQSLDQWNARLRALRDSLLT